MVSRMTSENAALQRGGTEGGPLGNFASLRILTTFRTAATNAVCSTTAPLGTRLQWFTICINQ